MPSPLPDEVLAHQQGVVVRRAAAGDLAVLAQRLDRAEAADDAPLVDEAERRRLGEAVGGTWPPDWSPLVARIDTEVVGYGALVAPRDDAGTATGDVAVLAADRDRVLPALLAALVARVGAVGTDDGGDANGGVDAARVEHVEAWVRRATAADLTTAGDAGWEVSRRLAVLARDLDPPPGRPVPAAGVDVRAFTEADAGAVVDVLAAAYAGTPDGGWDRNGFDDARAYDWFRPEDLLVAEVDGQVRGVHWTKRRGEGVGEVHNLAVHPAGQGRGLGATLLLAGLAHLAGVGCDRVLLWVDLANERAVDLYTSHGFATAWEDVLLAYGPSLSRPRSFGGTSL